MLWHISLLHQFHKFKTHTLGLYWWLNIRLCCVNILLKPRKSNHRKCSILFFFQLITLVLCRCGILYASSLYCICGWAGHVRPQHSVSDNQTVSHTPPLSEWQQRIWPCCIFLSLVMKRKSADSSHLCLDYCVCFFLEVMDHRLVIQVQRQHNSRAASCLKLWFWRVHNCNWFIFFCNN